jgi:hypothetical protein
MSQFEQPHSPQNLVANIVGKRIYLENLSDQIINIVKRMGAFQMAYGADLIWLIECAGEDELVKTLLELNRLGFIFIGGHSGYPAADMFAFLLKRNKLSATFKEILSRGPGDWFIIERGA